MVAKHARWGFWKCYDRLRLDGHRWNHKRVLRVYRAMGLNLPRRAKKRIPVRDAQTMEVAAVANAIWGVDFMSDALWQGRRFRTFNVLDEGVREVLRIEVDTSLPSARVVRILDELVALRGAPQATRCDNGPEFIAGAFIEWCARRGVELRYIQKGKPNQNAYVERFNRTYRSEVLDAYLFDSLDQVRRLTEEWMTVYNEKRPHDALGKIPPSVFPRATEAESSTLEWST